MEPSRCWLHNNGVNEDGVDNNIENAKGMAAPSHFATFLSFICFFHRLYIKRFFSGFIAETPITIDRNIVIGKGSQGFRLTGPGTAAGAVIIQRRGKRAQIGAILA